MSARKTASTASAQRKRAPAPAPEPAAPAWPADKVERWPTAKLIPYARNARTHSDAQVAQIAGSIREWGWTVPVLVDEDGTIIAGHGRVMAAHLLSLPDIPVMVARGWSEAQRRAYTLADNKLALNAGWDMGLLKIEVSDLRDTGFDLSTIGFADFEVTSLLELGVESEPEDEWNGMPEHEQGDKTAFRRIVVHFKDQESIDGFAALIGQNITDKTRFVWYPEIVIETYVDKAYTTSEP